MSSRPREVSNAGTPTRAIRSWLVTLAAGAAAVLIALGTVPPAAAEPPLTVAEAKSLIDQLETDAAAIDQDYVGVREQIAVGKAKLALKQADVAEQTAKVAQMKQQVGQVALAKFQNRNLDTAAQLIVSPDTEGFLSQVSTVEKVTENQNSVLQDFQQEQATLADLEHSSSVDLAVLAEQEKKLKQLRQASDAKIAESKAVLARLTAEERRRIAEEERKATERANSAGNAATSDDPGTPAGSGRGAKALAFAKSQIGKPYVFGAEGPNAYDCSGLTLAAWRAAGVNLPRTSSAQFGVGRAVSRSELQPGDLVFFYSDLSHVGLYAGNGMIVHSPRPGKSVQFIDMSYMPFVGARRPG